MSPGAWSRLTRTPLTCLRSLVCSALGSKDRCAVSDAPRDRAGLVDLGELDPLALRRLGRRSLHVSRTIGVV